jgi:signal transduction histidine kinase
VKAVSDAHGGRLWLESQVGVGTTFHLALPIQGPQDARIPE